MTRQAWEHRLLFAQVMEAIEDYIASKNLPPGARITIEPAVIGLVVDKVDDGDLARLEDIVRKLELAETFEELVALDIGFHQMLMGITRNPLLTEFSGLLKEFFIVSALDTTARSNASTVERYESVHERAVSEHWKLYEAVKKKDKQRAQDLMLKHIMWRNDELIDLCASHGGSILGHKRPKVVEAVGKALEMGILCSYETQRQGKLADKVSSMAPGAELMRPNCGCRSKGRMR